jgi:ADP-ribosylglycohydrolase
MLIMKKIPHNYIEKLYAGLLGKAIGVRLGAPIEGWSYEMIKRVYGEIDGYLVDYKDFAADDDTNGPLFLIRALDDFTYTSDITAEQIGITLLNYAPYEHGFFWWGGYGKSTEHTAYLNLRNGIMAPRSGSIEQNGAAVAEQIGGQIFIDAWGLVVPGNPMLAAKYAEKAASVTHGGNGVYGGMFIAACISAAFVEHEIERIIEAGLSTIPKECEYTRMCRDVMDFYNNNSKNWRDCFEFVKSNYGYERYPGVCHIIPNSAVIILSLLYSEGDFSKAINICNMCGWDTDCNVGNVGTIMGVLNGLAGIDYNKWRKPINDFIACSGVVGSLNIVDIPRAATYIANLAYKIADEKSPDEWKEIIEGKASKFHFEFSGSTHGFRVHSDIDGNLEYALHHTEEEACSGKGALKVIAKPLSGGNEIRVFHKTYYRPKDFHDSRYDPSFSPILYPGQTVKGCVKIPKGIGLGVLACLYVKDSNSGCYVESPKSDLVPGEWTEFDFNIPKMEGACLEEAGVKLILKNAWNSALVVYLDDFDFTGTPEYAIDFSKEKMEVWNGLHQEVGQFTYLKGIWKIEDGHLRGSCCDFGEAYTGAHDWNDYSYSVTLIPQLGVHHRINFRVQGAVRSYAVGLAPNNKLVLYKNENGYKILAEKDFIWEHRKEYTLRVEINSANIKVSSGGQELFTYTDKEMPYLKGQVGMSVFAGSHCQFKNVIIGRVS